MAPMYDEHDYYKKMLELQEKLRKSEEERIRLEERFKMLMQESRSRHDACINRLRLRYIEFLEEQRTRDERNHKLLGTLDRIDGSLALMTAKTDRLNTLRKQYEAYLLRTYANRGPPGSVTGDSGIASQNEERCPRRNVPAPGHPVPPDTKSSPRVPGPGYRANSTVSRSLASRSNREPGDNVYDSRQTLDTRSNTARNNFQADTRVHLQIHSPIPWPDKSPTDRMDAVQPATSPVLSDLANETVSRYKLHGPAVDRVAPHITQRQFRPSTKYSGVSQTPIRTSEQISPISRTGSLIAEPGPALSLTPFNSNRQTGRPPGYADYSSRSSPRDLPTRPLTSVEVDDMIRRNERLVPRTTSIGRVPQGVSTLARPTALEEEENRTTMTLENELDRYIGRIKNLHRELDMQSLEELDHEQNTSGDLLNVSLSDDDLELQVEGKARDEQLPDEVEKVLAIASDLASRTVVSVGDDSGKQDQGKNSGGPEESNELATLSDVREGRGTPVALVKDGISGDTALHGPELDRHENIEIEKHAKLELADPNSGNVPESRIHLPESPDVPGASDVLLDEKIPGRTDEETGADKKDEDPGSGEMELERGFDSDRDFESANPERIQEGIEEIDEVDKDQSTEKEEVVGTTESDSVNVNLEGEIGQSVEAGPAKQISEPEKLITGKESSQSSNAVGVDRSIESAAETESAKLEDASVEKGISESIVVDDASASKEIEADEVRDTPDEGKDAETSAESKLQSSDEQKDTEDAGIEESKADDVVTGTNQSEEARVADHDKDRSIGEEYVAEPNLTESYEQPPGQNLTDVNQEYAYDQNVAYETSDQGYQGYPDQEYPQESGEQYEQYAEYGQYEQDPNAQYEQDPNAQYEQDPNAQYEQDPNAQYEQDPNAQYEQDPNAQYEQDPNAQYEQDPNIQYEQDPNVQYEQDPNVQYEQDPNVQYEQDPNVQYEQDPNVQYEQDPNAQYEQDPSQYEYNYDQQYDPNTQYEYTENVEYDPNQGSVPPNEAEVQNQGADESGAVKPEQPSEQKPEESGEKVEQEDQEQSEEQSATKKKKDVIKSLLDSDTESTIERNVSTTESDFDFN